MILKRLALISMMPMMLLTLATVLPIASATPPAVTCSVQSDGVHVSWTSSPAADSYNVYRKTGNGSFVLLQHVTTTSYVDGTAAPGNTYAYEVRASKNGHEGQTIGDCTVATVPFFPSPLALGAAVVGGVGIVGLVAVRRRRS